MPNHIARMTQSILIFLAVLYVATLGRKPFDRP